jgi:ATP-binding cassette subfamily B protein
MLVSASLKAAGVYDRVMSMPEKERTVFTREFDEKGIGLSGGEQQKICAARMFARQYDMAILDEPSSALDPVAESKMYDNLMEGTKDKTVIYISHRLSSATRSDNILVFAGGELIEQGNHEQLMALDGEYCKMFTLQASSYNKARGEKDE